MNRIRKSAAVVALLGALSAACAVAETAPLHDPGVWQKHQLNFYFMGFTSGLDLAARRLRHGLRSSG